MKNVPALVPNNPDDVISIPKDKNFICVLAELGEQTKNSWIVIHRNVFEHLLHIADNGFYIEHLSFGYLALNFGATESYSKTRLVICYRGETDWKSITNISSANIAFTDMVDESKNILWFKMAD